MAKGGKGKGQGRNKDDEVDPPVVIEPDEDDPTSGNDPLLITYEAPTIVPDGTVPYYVEALVEDDYRFNYPEAYGTADVVTFTFLDAIPDYYSTTSWVYAGDGFQAFSEQHQDITRAALEAISDFANITFVEVTNPDDAAITFGFADMGTNPGVAIGPSNDGVGTIRDDIWLTSATAGDTFVLGSDVYMVLLHELGHTLGLGHPSISALPAEEDNRQYTLMSASKPLSLANEPETYMLYDIAALQYIYGANEEYATGDDVYTFDTFDFKLKTLWDAGGHDVLDLSAATYSVDIDLRPGAHSTIAPYGYDTLAIAFNTVIEDAVGGAYDDTIIGNEAENRLMGGGGDDILLGGGGNDTLDGGAGNDFLVGGDGADTFVFTDTNDGVDTVIDFMAGVDVIDLSGVTGTVTYEQRGDNAALLVDGDDFALFLSSDIDDLL